jgi:ribonucleoside-diphosphate reductase alpha chain
MLEGTPFPNLLSEFVYTRTYARWLDDEKRRETWPRTVRRYADYIFRDKAVPKGLPERAEQLILGLDVMPSMRALWCAGPTMDRDNTCGYNCSFLPVDNLRAFAEALYILMNGTGVGFSVERTFVDCLPPIAQPTGESIDYLIQDSTEGWADAVYFGMVQGHLGRKVNWNYSRIRPKGARLKTKGGRASGPEPLKRVLDFTWETIQAAAGRRLKTIEAHDIMCMEAEIVMVGGFRRASLISFSDVDDPDMRDAKDWSKGDFPAIRYMANNSAVYHGRPSEDVFWREWTALKKSGSGERGFYIVTPQGISRRGGDYRCNPCGEIKLRFRRAIDPWTGAGGGGQFCNLAAAIMRPDDTLETMSEKVRVATWLGVIQASYTHFPYLRPAWKELSDEDRLVGVDITGQCDNPTLSGDDEVMSYLNAVARSTAIIAADALKINRPAAITCGKPSGNSSQFVDCASGFHTRYAKFYFRHARISSKDPLFHLIRDQGVPLFKENGQEHLSDDQVDVWVARFPVKSPSSAKLREHERAIDQCHRYLQIMRTWCGDKGHNQSATIYVREDEWQEVGQWLWDNFDEVTGLSFLPYEEGGTRYRLAPYVEITEAEYEEAQRQMPKVNFNVLSHYETVDEGEGAQECACVGGACLI